MDGVHCFISTESTIEIGLDRTLSWNLISCLCLGFRPRAREGVLHALHVPFNVMYFCLMTVFAFLKRFSEFLENIACLSYLELQSSGFFRIVSSSGGALMIMRLFAHATVSAHLAHETYKFCGFLRVTLNRPMIHVLQAAIHLHMAHIFTQ